LLFVGEQTDNKCVVVNTEVINCAR